MTLAYATPVGAGRSPQRRSSSTSALGELHRAQLLRAAIEVVADVGYARLTVTLIIARAGRSRKAFYDHFANCDQCFVTALERIVGRARRSAIEAYREHQSWRMGIRAALQTLLELMEDQPGLARMFVVDALGAGPQALEFRREVVRELAEVLDLGRVVSGALQNPAPITAEAVAGGALGILHNRLRGHSEPLLPDLLGQLMSMIALPYLGARVAREELERPRLERTPRESHRRSFAQAAPPRSQRIRLTSHTVRALSAVAEKPDSSNREIAQRVGIADQGQASKLLKRLARLGLVRNVGMAKGGANAWQLTTRGTWMHEEARGAVFASSEADGR
jgi:AcrR family transcriptional regulator